MSRVCAGRLVPIPILFVSVFTYRFAAPISNTPSFIVNLDFGISYTRK